MGICSRKYMTLLFNESDGQCEDASDAQWANSKVCHIVSVITDQRRVIWVASNILTCVGEDHEH